jgi:LDH2 family malate/lactate/ureidoglycolate dehydrogenase
MDNKGAATNDPGALFTDPPGTLLPAGGLDHGHKGYALALLVEALSQGLGGYGRADSPTTWGASVYVQVWDPGKFAGPTDFTRQTTWIADAARGSRPARDGRSVRLPGERALALKRQSLSEGVRLHEGIMDALLPWAERFEVEPPGQS